MKISNIILWIVKFFVAVILIQTLNFKFSGHPDSVYIFEQTGLGSAGRIGSGVAELIISILILIPGTAWLGALGAIGTMSGAIFFHLTSLGIEVNDDGGTLFTMAVIVMLGGFYILFHSRKDIPFPVFRIRDTQAKS
ncbi:MAG: DoxX family protein [Saprospiraceae bacterium]|nr:DoxX family protein [Saprospiraceae bacterium]